MKRIFDEATVLVWGSIILFSFYALLWLFPSYLFWERHLEIRHTLLRGTIVSSKPVEISKGKGKKFLTVKINDAGSVITRRVQITGKTKEQCRPPEGTIPICDALDVIYLPGAKIDTLVKQENLPDSWIAKIPWTALIMLGLSGLCAHQVKLAWHDWLGIWARRKAGL
jgi:hypothetical protein